MFDEQKFVLKRQFFAFNFQIPGRYRYNSCVMDISVRRLNHRLALQLPKELPLGLVFVMGVVDAVNERPVEVSSNGRIRRIEFDLIEDDYCLHCILTQSIDNPTTVWEGEKVRVGGHLIFDPRHANYFLTTHDVEIIFDEEKFEPLFSEDSLALVHEQKALADALAGVKRRSQAAPQLEPAELPLWVKKIAPLELRESLGIWEEDLQDLDIDPVELAESAGAGDGAVLPDKMVSELGAAMDGDAEVEITTDLLTNYVGEDADAFGSAGIGQPLAQADAAKAEIVGSGQAGVDMTSPAKPYQEDIHETDWLVILLIVVFCVLIVLLIVAIAVLVLN